MRRRLICLLSMFLLTPLLYAQVELKVLLKQDQYLAKETLEIGIQVVNRSGQDLKLTGGNWLDVAITDSDDFLVKKIGPMPAPDDISVESTYMATQWLDIGKTFDFRENQQYTLRARLNVRDWQREYFSTDQTFEIIRGASIWQQKFGVPPEKPGDAPEFRTYVLQQAIYLKEPQLYLRVTDESGQKIFAVERLAPMIQVSQPEAQVDTLSQLHVFTQVTMKDFAHMIISPDGKIQQRHTYVAQGLRPSLKTSPSGGVYIGGGVRQLRKSDIPTPERFLAKAPLNLNLPPELEEEEDEPEPESETPESSTEEVVEPGVDPLEQAQEELEKRTQGLAPDQASSGSAADES